jgi:hydroxymethylglutaryl-CoA lyase
MQAKNQWPAEVCLHEVVTRDGIQNEAKIIGVEEKVDLIHRIVQHGVCRIEVSSFVNPKLVPQMADAEKLWKKIRREPGVLYSALVLNQNGLERAMACGVPHVGVWVSASETHSRKNSHRTVSEALKDTQYLMDTAKKNKMGLRAGIMNAFGCAYEGTVAEENVIELVKAFMKHGPDEICLADTSGMANPVQMERVIHKVKRFVGNVLISLHIHDTRGLGLANIYAALRQGITVFDTSIGGIGGCPFIPGAAGNVATEDTAYMLHQMGIRTGVNIPGLIQLSLRLEAMLGRRLPGTLSHLLGDTAALEGSAGFLRADDH